MSGKLWYTLTNIKKWADAHANLPTGQGGRESGCGPLKGQLSGTLVGPPSLEGFVFSESLIDHVTIQAFLETEYHVFGDSPFTLRIGEPNSALAAVYKRNCAESSAYITASNPNSKTLGDSENEERNNALRRELIERNFAFVEGVGKHPSNEWLGEASFLIFGIDLETARDLSRRMQQDAFVWAGSDWVPRLILLK